MNLAEQLEEIIRITQLKFTSPSFQERQAMWEFIRQNVRNAVLLGINDAMREIQSQRATEQEPEPVVLMLEYRPDEPASRNCRSRVNATK